MGVRAPRNTALETQSKLVQLAVASEARVRVLSHRSGSQSIIRSAVGFSPSANSPGNASRREANGSIHRCLHRYCLPTLSLPTTPQLI